MSDDIQPRWGRFDYEDWDNSWAVQAMSWKEQGLYSLLLKLQFRRGAIPADPQLCGRMLGVGARGPEYEDFAETFRAVVQQFDPVDNCPSKLRNARQVEERDRAIKKIEQRIAAGRASGKSRRNKEKERPFNERSNGRSTSAATVVERDIDVDVDVSSVSSKPAAPGVEKDAETDGRRTDPNEFFDKSWEPDGDCWRWTRAQDASGYGLIWNAGYRMGAHRFSFEKHHGRRVKKGRDIHHICENLWCVNPAHLEELTRAEHKRRHRSPEEEQPWNARLAPLARKLGGEKGVGDWLCWTKSYGGDVDQAERILTGWKSLIERGAVPWVKPGDPCKPASLHPELDGRPASRVAEAEYWRITQGRRGPIRAPGPQRLRTEDVA